MRLALGLFLRHQLLAGGKKAILRRAMNIGGGADGRGATVPGAMPLRKPSRYCFCSSLKPAVSVICTRLLSTPEHHKQA